MPLTREYLVRDLCVELGYPVVVVASPGLGTINHTLLTLEAVRAAGLEVGAVVMTPWAERPSRMELDNRATVAGLGKVRVEALPELDLSRARPVASARPPLAGHWSRTSTIPKSRAPNSALSPARFRPRPGVASAPE